MPRNFLPLRAKHLGPALLTTEYHAEGEEIIATLKFDTVKRRLTPDEAEVLRKAVVDIEKQSALPLTFESTGKTLLDGGHIREALAQFGSMAAKYPKKAIYHVQMSSALSEASCGDEARKQARLATQLEPNSAPAWHNLGLVLSRDLIGRSFHKGSDPRGAEAAYRKAMSLDPKDYPIQGDLAILLEFDSNGERYSPSARINEAVEIYLPIKDELPSLGLGNNLLYALAYARRFPELKQEAEKLDRSDLRSEMILVANAALSGTSAALKQLDSEGLSAQDRFTVIQTASTIFLRMRMYQQTSDLLQAAAPLSDQTAQIAARAELLRKVKVFEPVKLRMDSPLSAFLSMLAALITSNDKKFIYHTFLARESAVALAPEDQEESAFIRDGQQMFRAMCNRAGTSMSVMLDLLGSLTQTTSEPNGDDGLRVHLTIFGAPPITLYYVVEARQYKLLGDDSDYSGIARRVLEDVDSGKLEVARKWLDWLREEVKLQGGDDPIVGPVFPRFWTKGEQGDEKKIRSAAATLLGSTPDSDEALPLLQEALRSANDSSSRTAAELAYAVACLRSRKFSEALHPALELAKLYPDSVTAFGLVLQAFAGNSDWSAYATFAKQHLEKNPDEPSYGRALAENAGLQGRFEEAESQYHAIAQSSKGGVQDWNGFGWNALLAGTVTLAKIQEVQQGLDLASAQAQQPPAGVLHTLAGMYAEIGKTNEAREIIFRAMDSWQIDEPNEACWLVFGRIAEQLAVPDTALADYRRITQPKIKFQEKESNYYIAQQRIAVLEKNRSNDLASLK